MSSIFYKANEYMKHEYYRSWILPFFYFSFTNKLNVMNIGWKNQTPHKTQKMRPTLRK